MGILPPIVKDGRPRLEPQPREPLLADPGGGLRAAGVLLLLVLDWLAGSPVPQ